MTESRILTNKTYGELFIIAGFNLYGGKILGVVIELRLRLMEIHRGKTCPKFDNGIQAYSRLHHLYRSYHSLGYHGDNYKLPLPDIPHSTPGALVLAGSLRGIGSCCRIFDSQSSSISYWAGKHEVPDGIRLGFIAVQFVVDYIGKFEWRGGLDRFGI